MCLVIKRYAIGFLYLYYHVVDLPIWIETDGAIECLREYIIENKIEPPIHRSDKGVTKSDSSDNDDTLQQHYDDYHDMYVNMFQTGIEIIKDQLKY